ncbi:energy transducer TonB, partial [Antarcticimicrobium luteum]
PAPAASAAPTEDAVAAALAEALGGAREAAPTAAPTGPPLSAGEKEALRVAVSSCWNVGSLSSEALATTVVVAVSLSQDGKPQMETIRMMSYSGGGEGAAKQAFEAARRAIIRCGATGFSLPAAKYDRWRDIEMTFNPERMRIK